MNNASHLVAHQFKKKVPGSPSGHAEGKPAKGAPIKAVEMPASSVASPTILPAHTMRRNAAIALLVAGKVAAKKPVIQSRTVKSAC